MFITFTCNVAHAVRSIVEILLSHLQLPSTRRRKGIVQRIPTACMDLVKVEKTQWNLYWDLILLILSEKKITSWGSKYHFLLLSKYREVPYIYLVFILEIFLITLEFMCNLIW
jgi:hypothetical protein